MSLRALTDHCAQPGEWGHLFHQHLLVLCREHSETSASLWADQGMSSQAEPFSFKLGLESSQTRLSGSRRFVENGAGLEREESETCDAFVSAGLQSL